MKLNRLFFSSLLALSAVPLAVSSQPSVSNVDFVQQPDGAGSTKAVVTYELSTPDGPSTTTLLYSLNAAPFTPAVTVSGDVGPGQTTGTGKMIDWAVTNDLPGVESSNLVVRVLAEDGVAIPLTITSDVANGGSTYTPNQTLTFTFDEAVTGFDHSDVTVTNATKGAFSGTGPTYTLGIITNAFGAVSVSVPAGVAISSSGSANGTASASFEFDFEELLEFVFAPAGTFTMGRTATDFLQAFPIELPNHQVSLSPFDIGKFEVTNGQFATVMNWALAEGYLADNDSGDPYAGGGIVYLMAADDTSTRQALFSTVTDSTLSQLAWSGLAFTPRTRNSQSMADHPVLMVSWYGAVAFCNFLAELQGKSPAYNLATWGLVDADPVAEGLQYVASYRLPTESEWERAAGWTADLTTRFDLPYGANGLGAVGRTRLNFDDVNPVGLSINPRTSPVGFFNGLNIERLGSQVFDSFSPIGAYDMAGNAAEWVHDRYDLYTSSDKTDPTGPATGSSRVVRGGSWEEKGGAVRTAFRVSSGPAMRNFEIGFRVATVREYVPLSITAAVAEGETTVIATQTITFTFAEPVTGFDIDDIAVTGGTKGALVGVGAVYTLDVTGVGGTVGISVGDGAAASVASGAITLGDSYSNFYQDTWTIDLPGGVPMELIRIPAGTFTMGSPEGELSRIETPGVETQHEVTISEDFYLSRTEVTQAQWLAIEGAWPATAPSLAGGLGDDYPAYNVTYNDIQSFLTGLNAASGPAITVSLPTESQWEYAARAGTTTRFSFGDGLASDETTDTAGGRGDNMWFSGNNTPTGAKPVAQKSANPWGLYDMHGNVMEWCADWYDVYPEGPVTDPTGAATGTNRVHRGGSYGNPARFCRSAHRRSDPPATLADSLGFRVAAVRD